MATAYKSYYKGVDVASASFTFSIISYARKKHFSREDKGDHADTHLCKEIAKVDLQGLSHILSDDDALCGYILQR